MRVKGTGGVGFGLGRSGRTGLAAANCRLRAFFCLG